jgi:hypothetical protein
MNLLKKLALGLTVAGSALAFAPSASAATICSGCNYNESAAGTFLGVHNPNTGDLSTYTNSGLDFGTPTAFTNYWLFQIDPSGLAAVDSTFIPNANVTAFNVRLFFVSAFSCTSPLSTPSSTPGACSSFTYDSSAVLATGENITVGSSRISAISFLPLASGMYMFEITGTAGKAIDADNGYSGNLTTTRRVPEPATLALLAVGLMGAGFAARRRK